MPFDAICSACGATYSLRDEMQGRKVRCKKCQQAFVAEPAGNGNAFDFNGADDAVQDEKRPVKSAPKRQPAGDEEPERPRRRRDADDDGGKDRPPVKKKKSSTGLILGIIGGIGAVLLICCGGPIGFIAWGAYRTKQAANDFTAEMDRAMEEARQREQGIKKDLGKGPIIIPNGGPGNRRPGNLNEALEALRSGDLNRQRDAADWLCFQRAEPARKDEVGKALEPLLTDRRDATLRINAAKAMSFGWVSKDNKAALVRELQVPNGSPTEEQKYMMQALGALQDAQTAGVLARWLPQTEEARIALTKIGTPAEPEVLKYFNHNNPQARARARQLIQNWNSPRGPTCLQCAQDARSADRETRMAAITYLETVPRDPTVAQQVVAGLESAAADPDRSVAAAAQRALKVWRPTAGGDPAPSTGDGYAKALADLKSPDPLVRRDAANWFQTHNPLPEDVKRKEAATALQGLLTDNQQRCRLAAARALGRWGSPDNTTALLQALNNPDRNTREAVMEALGGIKDERAAQPLAAKLAVSTDRIHASSALKAIGPKAEKAVCAMLNPNATAPQAKLTNFEACRVLEVIGTKASLPVLMNFQTLCLRAKPPHRDLANAAQAAIQKISQRP